MRKIPLPVSIVIVMISLFMALLKVFRKHFGKKLVSDSNSRLFNTTKALKWSEKVIAFFHPHCSAGGGGERVLWKSVQALGELYDTGIPLRVVIYTKDEPHDSYKIELLEHVESRFSITISSTLPLAFIHLHKEYNSRKASRFTMIVEALDSMILGWRALQKFTPHIFIDTTGVAFTFLAARLFAGCKVVAYVHYPTISSDMISMVRDRRPSYNNNTEISSSRIITNLKLIYYSMFAVAYGFAGGMASLVMVNSSWTCTHIKKLWLFANVRIVYPPCDTDALQSLPLTERENIILSIGQFRPEKDHALQIRAFASLQEKLHQSNFQNIKLVLLGSCRNEGDETFVRGLQNLALELGVSHAVQFVINEPYSVVKSWLARGSIGIHTMWNEHFGIGIVEMMAAGLITIAHNSGGPKSDIIIPLNGKRTGYLASTSEEFSTILYQVLHDSNQTNLAIRKNGRQSAKRFSDEVFTKSFKEALVRSRILSTSKR